MRRLSKELTDEEKDEIWQDWKRLVNMSSSELDSWAKNPDRLEASINREEAEKAGDIQSGYDSLHRIKRRSKKNKSEWTPDDWSHAKQVIGFNSRMLGNDPGKPVGETGRSKWEISLRNWGHDPGKSGSPGRSKLLQWRKINKRNKKSGALIVSDQKLFEELVRVASENPGVVQDALLPVLQEYREASWGNDIVSWPFSERNEGKLLRTLYEKERDLKEFYRQEKTNPESELNARELKALKNTVDHLDAFLGGVDSINSFLSRMGGGW